MNCISQLSLTGVYAQNRPAASRRLHKAPEWGVQNPLRSWYPNLC